LETGSGQPGKTKAISSMTVTLGNVSFVSDDDVEIIGPAAFTTVVNATEKVSVALAGSKSVIGDFILSNVLWNNFPHDDDLKRQVAVTTQSNVVGSVTATGSSTTTRYGCWLVIC
jgi:hypothetical protein